MHSLLHATLLLATAMVGRPAFAVCGTPDYPLLAVSEGTVEFGEVAVGETRTADVRVLNQGDLPLGIAQMRAGTGDGSDRFPFSWSASEVECPPGSTGDTEGTTAPPDGLLLVLGPHCSLPVHVTFTPLDEGEVWGSILIASPDVIDFTRPDGDPHEDWWVDPLHAYRWVRLSGIGTAGGGSDGETGGSDTAVPASGVPYMVGGVDFSQTACEGGDHVEASVLVHDPDGQEVQYDWTGDEGIEIDPSSGSATVRITCSTIPTGSNPTTFSLSVVAQDEDGNSIWDFAELRVWPPGMLYGGWPHEPCDEVLECGCQATPVPAPSAALLLGLAWLLARRRRDRSGALPALPR
jgi:uncharacterized protein (TIGR03382 family)